MDSGFTRSRPKAAAIRVLRDPDTFGTTILVWALDVLGPHALTAKSEDHEPGDDHEEWTPAAIRAEIAAASGIEPAPINFDRLMAARAILLNDLFWRTVDGFNKVATALCGHPFDPTQVILADARECAWAITEAIVLDPPDDGEEPFSADVRRYIGHVLDDEGFESAPDVLGIAIRAPRAAEPDPETRGAAAAVQAEKKRDIEDLIRSGLHDLAAQLEALPLVHGDAARAAEKLRAAVRRETPRGGQGTHPTEHQ